MAIIPAEPKVETRPAKHGTGLFACKRFRPEQIIGEITGKIFDDPDYGSDYCIDLGEGGLEPAAPWRFLNHSCEPNSKLFVVFDDGDPLDERIVVLEALRNIQPGAELTIDYEWSADNAIPCGCSAINCRGWVVAKDELHQVPAPRAD